MNPDELITAIDLGRENGSVAMYVQHVNDNLNADKRLVTVTSTASGRQVGDFFKEKWVNEDELSEYLNKTKWVPAVYPYNGDEANKVYGDLKEKIQKLQPIDPMDAIQDLIRAMPNVTNAESQKRALALLLLQKLANLLHPSTNA